MSDFLGLDDDVAIEIAEGEASQIQNLYKQRKKLIRRKGTAPLAAALAPDQDLNGLFWAKFQNLLQAQEVLAGVHNTNVVDFFNAIPGSMIPGGANRLTNNDANAAWINQRLYIGDGYSPNVYVDIGGALAANFVNASTQSLNHVSNASLQLNATDWTIAGWVKFATVNNYRKVVTKQTSDVAFEYGLQLNPTGAGGQPGLEAYGSTGNCDSATVISAGAWYFFWVDFDMATNTLQVSVNNAAPASNVVTAPTAGAGTFGIGYYGGTTIAYAMDGQVDNLGLWKRKLSAGEKTSLYNGGNRVKIGSLTGAMLVNLISGWDFDNSSNIGLDSIGANNLANNNGVTVVPAPGSGVGPAVHQAMAAPPLTAPVVAAGGVGSGTGTYNFTISYLINGNLSEPGPISLPVVLVSQRVNMTAIPIAPEAEVAARYVWFTGGAFTNYQLCDIIPDNTSTTRTVDPSPLASPFSPLQFGNTRFPPCRYLVQSQSRMVGAGCYTTEGDRQTVYVSNLLQPFYAPLAPDLSLSSNGTVAQLQGPAAGEITGLCPHGDYVAVFTGGAGWFLIGSQAADFRLQQFANHGCVAHRTIQSVRHLLIWLGTDGVYSWNGVQLERISDLVRETITAMSAADMAAANSFVWYDRYYLCWPGHCLFFDLLNRQWGTHTAWNWRTSTVTTFTSSQQQRIYAALTGHAQAWQLETGSTDNGAAIVTRWKSRDWEMGMAAHQKRVHLVECKWKKSTGVATVNLYRGTGDLIQTFTQDLSAVDYANSTVVRMLQSAVEQARDENFGLEVLCSTTDADYELLAAGCQWMLAR